MSGLAPLADLCADLVRAHRGDADARARVVRRGLPIAADLVRPGAGIFAARGLELLDEWRAYDGARAQPDGQDEDDLPADVPPWDSFVPRFLGRRRGFHTIVGDDGTGKTTLALRLAQRLRDRLGYDVVAVGGIHPDDRARWDTDAWISPEPAETFLEAMDLVAEAMLDPDLDTRPIERRVILLDDASLLAHVSAQRFNRALTQAWSVCRHVRWHVVVTARTFKTIGTVAENADCKFVKRPNWESLKNERDEALEWWEAADRAYHAIRETVWWQRWPSAREWVYVHSPRLRYRGMLRYAAPDELSDDELDELEGGG